jgi:hypothetical protein
VTVAAQHSGKVFGTDTPGEWALEAATECVIAGGNEILTKLLGVAYRVSGPFDAALA